MVTYLAGNRIRGTSTERTSTSGFNPISAVSGGWKELGRTTLGSAGDTISVASLADKRYYMVLGNPISSGNVSQVVRFNDDSGSNYSSRRSDDGGSDTTHASESSARIGDNNAVGNSTFTVTNISNLASKEKLLISHGILQNTAGAGTAPARREVVSKWANTSNAISRIDSINTESGDYASDSEVVVLGWDPDDTHTDNFWEQIGTASGTGLTDITLDSSKKYNWLQAHFITTSSSAIDLQLGNTSLDTGNNYSHRRSTNGGADATVTGDNGISFASGWTSSYRMFLNAFIINNSANEKLVIANIVYTLVGASNTPARYEIVGKWANTSSQFNHIGIVNDASSLIASSEAKVWGSD